MGVSVKLQVARSPDERSDIRERRECCPGYRFAHPGYKTLRCPTGKTPKRRVNPLV